MSEVNCPYCGHEQEINHDDGYGYDEGKMYEQECASCGNEFNFNTRIELSYDVFCKNGDHNLERIKVRFDRDYFECSKCDYIEIRHILDEIP